MSDWMLEKARTGPGALIFINECLWDQASLILVLSVHLSLSCCNIFPLPQKPNRRRCVLHRWRSLASALACAGLAEHSREKIVRKQRFVKGCPQTLLLLKYTLCMPSASVCAWSLHWILFFFFLSRGKRLGMGGRGWVMDARFTEINEIVSKRESFLSAHNKILHIKLTDWLIFNFIGICLTK